MRTRTLVTLLGIFLVVTGMTDAWGAPKQLLNVPLKWAGEAQLKRDKDATFPGTAIQIEDFQDARDDRELIGENREEATPKPVTTSDDVGPFVADHVRTLLTSAGVNVVDGNAAVIIRGKVTQFFVTEIDHYNSQVTVQLAVVGRNGRMLWSGAVSGEARQRGHSYKLENYYENLSTAVYKLTESMLQNPGLIRTLAQPARMSAPVDQSVQTSQPGGSSSQPGAGSSSTRRLSAGSSSRSTSSTVTATVSTAGAWMPDKRFALVIGNSTYGRSDDGIQTWPDLQGGPLRDADAVAARLKQLHFDVTLVKDADRNQMTGNLAQFYARIRAEPESLALFYFAGHGAQAPRGIGEESNDSYLIPVRTSLSSETDARFEALPLEDVANTLQRSHVRAAVVILDACRDNALKRLASSRAATRRGLAQAYNMTGMLFAYSTQAGEVTPNRPGKPSFYTQALVEQLGKPGQSVTTAFRNVRKQIADTYGHGNLPELRDELNEDIVLAR
jgi:hypothetical protein